MISDRDKSVAPVRLGVAGLGRGFMLTLPAFRADPRVALVAAAAPRAESRAAFEAEFGGRGYPDVAALCADPDVEAIYVATPHQMHAEHVEAAALAGKHVLVDKPLCVSVDDGRRMVNAARETGIHLIVGPSHSFDAPVALARLLVESGEFGRLRMIHAFNYTDFLYRPRRPEELRTAEGGGVLFSQGVHQIDMVRLLAGGMATRVSAMTGAWDPERPTEGAYSAQIAFENGVFATLVYSGYAHFDSDEWMDWTGELGQPTDPSAHGAARRALAAAQTPEAEAAMKQARTYGGASSPAAAVAHEHFGPAILACDRADLRLTPTGVAIYGDREKRFEPAPAHTPRSGVIDALVAAVRHGVAPVQSGRWGLASLEICHAILRSAETGQPVGLALQVGTKPEENLP